MPGIGPYITGMALGLPNTPQPTAEFCALPPPNEFPTIEDYAFLAFPPAALARGVYRRLGNLARAAKWAELCVCVAEPSADEGFPPPAGYYVLRREACFSYDQPIPGRVPYVWGPLPPNTLSVAIHQTSGDYAILGPDLIVTDKPMVVGVALGNAPNDPATLRRGTLTDHAGWFECATLGDPDHPGFLSLATSGAGGGPSEACFDLAYLLPSPPPPYAAPTMPEPPDGYPTSGAACDTATLPDICRALAALTNQVSWIAAQLVPPALVPKDDAEEAPSGTAVHRPATSVGAIITATLIPAREARYGGPPTFFPTLGHYALMTENGPLPSVLIKHSPLVVFPIPPQVTDIVLDLGDGVVANVRWLDAPK